MDDKMILLHADKNDLNGNLLKELESRDDLTYIHMKTEDEVLDFLDENRITMIIIGEQLGNNVGLNLIDLINNSKHFKVPIIYVVEDEGDILLENYSAIGIRDCLLRSNLDLSCISKHLVMLNEQSKLYGGLSHMSVAVIDDSPLAIKAVTDILKDEGMRNIKTFSDPSQLLKEYKSFSLFIVDIVMPEITGDKLVGMIRDLTSDSIIIAMSSVDNVKTISHVLTSGADDYIVKPFNNFELRARIRTNYRSYSLLKELEKKNRQLDLMSKTDSLTGAFNHGFIVKSIKAEVEKSKTSGEPLSMLMIDLDLFKSVNDHYGHAVGDTVLISLAKLFIRKNRKYDIFGRYGGEEFILLMPNTPLSKGVTIAKSLNRIFSNLEIKGMDRAVTFSGGVVQWDGLEDYISLMKRSDDLLYLAKENGRDVIEFDK